MGDNGDLRAAVESLAKAVAALQTTVEAHAKAIAAFSSDRSSTSGSKAPAGGEHHQDRPLWLQQMDFPRFDGRSDPLIFINRCESYFRQQRIMEEEKVWMASRHLEESAKVWYTQVQQDQGTPRWRKFSELLKLHFEPPLSTIPLDEFMASNSTGSVVDSHDHFEELLLQGSILIELQPSEATTAAVLPTVDQGNKLLLTSVPQAGPLKPTSRPVLPTFVINRAKSPKDQSYYNSSPAANQIYALHCVGKFLGFNFRIQDKTDKTIRWAGVLLHYDIEDGTIKLSSSRASWVSKGGGDVMGSQQDQEGCSSFLSLRASGWGPPSIGDATHTELGFS